MKNDSLKNLPTKGIQDFKKLIEEDNFYLDKTEYAYEIFKAGGHNILVAPRRFGKSLFASTLKSIALGEKDLFKNLCIQNMYDEWEKYPIIYLDFSSLHSSPEQQEEKRPLLKLLGRQETTKSIKSSLIRKIELIAIEEEIAIDRKDQNDPSSFLEALITKMHEKYGKRVVLIIDEYDSPVMQFFNPQNKQIKIAKNNAFIIKGLFQKIKSCDAHIKFQFVTGVHRISTVIGPTGSQFNDLRDSKAYSTVLGCTENEARTHLLPYIERMASNTNRRIESIFKEMKNWYNGYLFTEGGELVYNLLSSMKYISNESPASYWGETGTPGYAIEFLKNASDGAMTISKILQEQEEVTKTHYRHRIDVTEMAEYPTALLTQLGYLTIKKTTKDSYILGFPNNEVRSHFKENLLKQISSLPDSEIARAKSMMKNSLNQNKMLRFFQEVYKYTNTLTHNLFNFEGIYQLITYMLADELIAPFKPQLEKQSNIGRSDVCLETKNAIYILEFKYDRRRGDEALNDSHSYSKLALAQIIVNKYWEPFLNRKKPIILIGIAARRNNLSSFTESPLASIPEDLFTSPGKEALEAWWSNKEKFVKEHSELSDYFSHLEEFLKKCPISLIRA